MGIRETLNQNPGITTGVTAGIVIIALGFIIWQLAGSGDRPSLPTKMYYTDDDGATKFSDDINKVPPFDHKGKQAVRARVFTCDGGKTQFIAYLERYTPEAKAKLEKSKSGSPEVAVSEEIAMSGIEVKAPKPEAKWVKQSDPAARKITTVNCPSGNNETLEPVMP